MRANGVLPHQPLPACLVIWEWHHQSASTSFVSVLHRYNLVGRRMGTILPELSIVMMKSKKKKSSSIQATLFPFKGQDTHFKRMDVLPKLDSVLVCLAQKEGRKKMLSNDFCSFCQKCFLTRRNATWSSARTLLEFF